MDSIHRDSGVSGIDYCFDNKSMEEFTQVFLAEHPSLIPIEMLQSVMEQMPDDTPTLDL